jgi:hypothetical protein
MRNLAVYISSSSQANPAAKQLTGFPAHVPTYKCKHASVCRPQALGWCCRHQRCALLHCTKMCTGQLIAMASDQQFYKRWCHMTAQMAV